MQKGLPNRLNAKILDVLGGPIRSSKDKRASSFFRDGSAGIAYDFTSAGNLLWRYNLLTWSEDFTNAAWVKANGAVSGTRFTPNTTAAVQHRIDQVSAIPAGPQVLWAELKYAGYQWASLRIGANGAAFDIQNGVVGGVVSGTTATITPLGNGNYLCAFFDPNAVASATSRINVEPSDTIGGQFAGDGINGLDIIRAQREVGSTINSYQKITDPDMDAVFYCPQNPLYQDTTGSMAVTTPDETVGLALDTSRGLSLGPELVTNGDFSAGATGWTYEPGWTFSGLATISASTAANPGLSQAGVLSPARLVRYTFTVSNYTSGTVVLRCYGSGGNDAIISVSQNGTYSGVYSTRSDATGLFGFSTALNTSLSIDNISVRAINSVPLLQANAGLRPKWGIAPASRRNLLVLGGTAFLTSTDGVSLIDNAPTGFTPPVDATFQRITKNAVASQFYAYRASQIGSTTDPSVFSWYMLPEAGCTQIGMQTSASAQGQFRYNLSTGLTTKGVNTADAGAIPIGGGWYRCWTKTAAVTGTTTWGVVATVANTSDAASFVVGGHQSEANVLTAFQKTTSAFDMTEAGVPAYGFIRHDLVDDVLSATIPTAQTGDVLVFGRRGSWIESGVTYGAGSTWSVGAATVTGLPAGLLSAIGDIVGIVAIGRTLTSTERQQALDYHKARGAAGWLVAGAELVTNGDFSGGTTGWASGATLTSTASVVSGEMQVTATVVSGRQLQAKTLVVGQPYLLTGIVRKISGTGGAYLVAGFNTELNSANSAAVTVATATPAALVFVPTTTAVNIGLSGASSGDVCGFDNVSLKPLTVAA